MNEERQNSKLLSVSTVDNTDESTSILSGIIFFLLCLIFILSVVLFGGVDILTLGLNSVLIGLLAIFWLLETAVKKEFRYNPSVLQIPIFGLIVIGAMQLLPVSNLNLPAGLLSLPATATLSAAPYSTRFALVQLVGYFIFFAAALAFINNLKRLQKLVGIILFFGTVAAAFGVLQRFSNSELIYGFRAPGQAFFFASFINQHHFAAFMEMTIGLTLGLLFGKKAVKSDKKILLVILVLIMGTALVLTASRGGLISLLAVVAFIVIISARQKSGKESQTNFEESSRFRRVAVYAGSGLFLILLLLGSVLLFGGDDSLLRGIGFANQADFSNGRLHFWSVAWQIFLDNPILGAGLDAFGTVFPKYDSWNGFFRVEQAHNDYLQTLADAGILGFACIAAFVYFLFKKSLPVMKNGSDYFARGAAFGSLAGCFGILIHSFVDFPLRTPSNMFCFLILTVMATNFIMPEKIARKRRTR